MSEQQWHYLDAQNQQLGPVNTTQLQELVSQGQITPTTQIWTEGLEAWIPAEQVEGLFTPQPEATPTPTAESENPYEAPTSEATIPTGGDYPVTVTSKSSFGKMLGFLIGGILLMLVGTLLAGAGKNAALVGGIFGLIGYALVLATSVMQFIFLYKAWKCLQPGGGSITPGKAVGFLFIPFFGIYWFFVVFIRFSKEWNRITSQYNNTQDAPKMNETAFLLHSIGLFVPLIQIVTFFIVNAQMVRAINFMATIGNPNPFATSTTPGTGLNFGPATIPTNKD